MESRSVIEEVICFPTTYGRYRFQVLSWFVGLIAYRLDHGNEAPGIEENYRFGETGAKLLIARYGNESAGNVWSVEPSIGLCNFLDEEEFLKFLLVASNLKLKKLPGVDSILINEAVSYTIVSELEMLKSNSRYSNINAKDVKLRLIAAMGPILTSFDAMLADVE